MATYFRQLVSLSAEYQGREAAELLNSPFTCIQGVSKRQLKLMQNNFSVYTVKEVSNFNFFLQSQAIMKLVENANFPSYAVISDIERSNQLGFEVMPYARQTLLADLPRSSIGILKGFTPHQQITIYEALRISTVFQLANNRIIRECQILVEAAKEGPPIQEKATEEFITAKATPAVIEEDLADSLKDIREAMQSSQPPVPPPTSPTPTITSPPPSKSPPPPIPPRPLLPQYTPQATDIIGGLAGIGSSSFAVKPRRMVLLLLTAALLAMIIIGVLLATKQLSFDRNLQQQENTLSASPDNSTEKTHTP